MVWYISLDFDLELIATQIVYKLASLKELIRISCFYDSKVYHWFHTYFEGFIYTYWEELDLQRTTEWDLNRSDQVLRTKIIPLCSSIEEPSV